MIEPATVIERFNTNKYHILAQDFKINLAELVNLQCLGISKISIETVVDGINIEAIKSEQPLQKCSEIEETVKREFILWVTEFQLQMKYYVQDLKRKERYNKMEQEAKINGDLWTLTYCCVFIL